MNEPTAAVGLALLGAWLAVPALHALVLALVSRAGSKTIWMTWAIGFVLIASSFWTLTASLRAPDNPGDTQLAVSILIGTGAATALAAFALTRLIRRSPHAGMLKRAGLAVGVVIAGMVAWVIAPGAP